MSITDIKRAKNNVQAYDLVMDIIGKIDKLKRMDFNPNFKSNYMDIPLALYSLRTKAEEAYNRHFYSS